MNSKERRKKILSLLMEMDGPVTGVFIAEKMNVSRQIIVSDIALLRAEGCDILSTSQGYVLNEAKSVSRVFKVIHSDEDVEKELNLFVDLGGRVSEVFVYHRVYGVVRAEMNIRSRLDVRKFVSDLKNGKSSPLKNVTSGYHYHTVHAEDVKILDIIGAELEKNGFLAPVMDYEPVEF